jgi:16S rRNA (cytidine1402-2'-O)-methyltransferase
MTIEPGKLYLVPTPIGNMDDITPRAVATLKAVDIVACEDTRHSGRFLKTLGVNCRMQSYHDFNEQHRAGQLTAQIKEGQSVAVITDAGSPGISDPAYRLVRAALEDGIEIIPLPGPTALIPALTASGLPTDRFFFEGFLSNKSAARQRRLEQLSELEHTLVFYESPHRVAKCLADMHEVLGDRSACLAREISKKFEQFLRGRLSEIIDRVTAKPVKGEIVLVVAGTSFQRKLDRSESDV